MLSQCTRDFGPYNDNLFLCPCLALDFPHCNSSQRGSFLFIFPLYIILILNWLFYSGSCMACTSFLAPSYLMLLAACIHVPPLGLKVFFFFFVPYPDVVGFHHWVSPHCALGFCSLGEMGRVLILVCPLLLYPVRQATGFVELTLRLRIFFFCKRDRRDTSCRVSPIVAAPPSPYSTNGICLCDLPWGHLLIKTAGQYSLTPVFETLRGFSFSWSPALVH